MRSFSFFFDGREKNPLIVWESTNLCAMVDVVTLDESVWIWRNWYHSEEIPNEKYLLISMELFCNEIKIINQFLFWFRCRIISLKSVNIFCTGIKLKSISYYAIETLNLSFFQIRMTYLRSIVSSIRIEFFLMWEVNEAILFYVEYRMVQYLNKLPNAFQNFRELQSDWSVVPIKASPMPIMTHVSVSWPWKRISTLIRVSGLIVFQRINIVWNI